MARLWHYTTLQKYTLIDRDKRLRAFAPPKLKDYKPTVWFSTSPDWDQSANLIVQTADGGRRRASLDETIVVGGGLVRIEVAPEVAPHDWQTFKRTGGVTAKIAKSLYDTAIRAGSRPSWWFVSFADVAADKWLAVELFQDGWQPDPNFTRTS